ncbi:GAF and ANTAR domain-containing protein [Mycobacterium sp. SM1]|uniref:GAF and ANTAR domain-containing protein n=1 Tax=Mycobacterium sp. SM1 TaxID=2816243 RepID=UPI001BCFB29F|nr:GAF and ANTAR domain-containing protein [Mycobacterium sp. SM1]MBS4727115.1 GAF and ANTAR domain-containing protein [Mycobacterium sp. SM1]
MYTTDGRATEVEELQATVGQGPAIDALDSGMPIIGDDLASPTSLRRWPAFAPEMTRIGVRAMYSLPLALGAIRVGVLDLYHDTPRELTQDQLLDALVYADTALLLVLDSRSGIATPTDGSTAATDGPMLWHAEVHQAAGMVSEQLGISVLDALVRLRAHAYGHGQQLTDVARSVVERRLRFHPDAPATGHDRKGHP